MIFEFPHVRSQRNCTLPTIGIRRGICILPSDSTYSGEITFRLDSPPLAGPGRAANKEQITSACI